MITSRRAGVLVSILTIVPLAVHSPAWGHNYQEDCYSDRPCEGNDFAHKFSYHLTERLRAATERTRINSYDTTALTVTLASDSEADVIFYVDDNLPSNTTGRYYCFSVQINNAHCNRAEVRYHGDLVGATQSNYTDTELTHLACHEVGHSVALRHPADVGESNVTDPWGCMVQGRWSYVYVGAHNTDHINRNSL